MSIELRNAKSSITNVIIEYLQNNSYLIKDAVKGFIEEIDIEGLVRNETNNMILRMITKSLEDEIKRRFDTVFKGHQEKLEILFKDKIMEKFNEKFKDAIDRAELNILPSLDIDISFRELEDEY